MASQTHRELVQLFRHYPVDNTGYIPDEDPYSDLALIDILHHHRATVLKLAINKGDILSEQNIQTLGCVDICELDRQECPCAPASGCYWLKTECVVPREIQIVSVTGTVANGDNPRFSFIKWDRFQYIPKSRSNSVRKGRYYTLRTTEDKKTFMYLYGDRFLKNISISGIFENPIEAAQFPICGEQQFQALCFPLDVDFYADGNYRNQIINLTWQEILPLRGIAITDTRSDDHAMQPITTTQ